MSIAHYRRAAYYLIVVLIGLMAHQGVVATVLGSEIGDLLRRNSEAYVMMWIPLYWDLFGFRLDPDGRGSTMQVGGRVSVLGQSAWLGLMLVAALALQTDLIGGARATLPQAISTLGEAFVAGLAVAAYLGWSRGLFVFTARRRSGVATVGASRRALYYAAVVAVAVVAEQSWAASAFGDWLRLNTEAFAAMILIPAYFDLVAPSGVKWSRLIFGALLAVPVSIEVGVLGELLPGSLVDWLETTTEAFVAAIAIGLYFDLLRGRAPAIGDHDSSSGEVPDHVAEESV